VGYRLEKFAPGDPVSRQTDLGVELKQLRGRIEQWFNVEPTGKIEITLDRQDEVTE
jgi:hypothetical protein